MRKIIYLGLSFLLLATLITFHILGSKERVGYLSDFEIIEGSKSNYIYNFRIRYYDKVFRNSDIYGVYLITNSLPEYIKEIKMNELGSPFGIIISDKIIKEEKIDNIKYILRLKIILVFILLAIVLYSLVFFEFTRIDLFNLLKLFIRKLKLINIKNKFGVILILFLCFLIMPNIIYRIFYKNFDHTNYENRTLASKPIFMSTNINEYPKKYEEYFNDYLPFRNELVKLKNLNDIFVFKNIISDRVLLGKAKWLFVKWYDLIEQYIGIEGYNFSEKELEIAKNNLIHFRDELKKKNIDFIFMVCPDKQFIYSEYMPDYIKRKPDNKGTDFVIEYIKSNTDIKVVYPKNELLKYKDKYQLYYKYDSHWNTLGAYIGYTELTRILNIDNKSIESFKILEFDSAYRNSNKDSSVFYNDMARMVSLNDIKKFRDDIIYILEDYKYTITNITDDWRSSRISNYNLDNFKNNRNILIIGDSYSFEMMDYIITTFKQSEFIHERYFENKDIKKYKPDIVVFQSVERNLKYRILNAIPNYKIEEINED